VKDLLRNVVESMLEKGEPVYEERRIQERCIDDFQKSSHPA
jgi:hypothetical protein